MKSNTPPTGRRPGLQPPRFRLATLMVVIAVWSVIFALVGYLGWHGALLVAFFALAIAVHVAGNALGTRLRENGDTPLPPESPASRREARFRGAGPGEFAPATRLRDRRSLGRPIVRITALGAVLSGVTGGVGAYQLLRDPLTLGTVGSIALGVCAAAVLGGIWTFLAASFLKVGLGAFWQATRGAKKADLERIRGPHRASARRSIEEQS